MTHVPPEPTLRDAELRSMFADAYLVGVQDEYRQSPKAWEEKLKEAQLAAAIARRIYRRLARRHAGLNGDLDRHLTAAAG